MTPKLFFLKSLLAMSCSPPMLSNVYQRLIKSNLKGRKFRCLKCQILENNNLRKA
ncbi:unnamed protein product [Moneuplotes crassus]|uniref:Uncharacterized protein n=1 Tax=Euplotes crassus TaxID=5936 RepID=A0AAD1XZL5_EUPCR|nr:unnamed protein product [Moneuplotes crassus]